MRFADKSSGSTSPRFFAPKPDQSGFVLAHDNPGIRAADEGAPVYSVESGLWQTFLHGILDVILRIINCVNSTCDNSTIACL